MTCKGLIFAAGHASNPHLPLDEVSGLGADLLNTPRIRFPLAVMEKAGVRQVIIAAKPEDIAEMHVILGDGRHIGVNVSYLMLECDSSIELTLSSANRFIAKSSVLLVSSDVCCTNFQLPDSGSISPQTVLSFRMQNGAVNPQGERPEMLIIGSSVLNRLRRQTTDLSRGAKDVDQLRRACMSRFKYQDVDLTQTCTFVNLKKGITIDNSLMSESAQRSLLSIEPSVAT
ncbi:MAG: hypothetical protein F4239_00300 [Gammaproteobacteria bacterium]|nr:hypothetical protein [Gammaproteobacteria bacterium]